MNTIKVYIGNSKGRMVRYAQENNEWYESPQHAWGWGFWTKCENQNNPHSELQNLRIEEASNLNLTL